MHQERQAHVRKLSEHLVDDAIERLAGMHGGHAFPDSSTLISGIAEAAAASPAWRLLPAPTLIVRPAPSPVIAFVGEFSRADRARIDAFFIQLDHALQTARHVSYARAEADVRALARRLQSAVGPRFLNEARFHAIPRGGLIVLGMLAAVLRVPPQRIGISDPQADEGHGPVVLVDDCAITGMRVRDHLRPGRPTVVAHLYSHPDLRAAVQREPDVVACISAQDLGNFAHDGFPRRDRWGGDKGQRYWYGLPEFLTFAWKEPDTQLWNPVTNEMEGGWRIMPPALCLPSLSRPPPHGHVVVQDGEPGPIRSAPHVFYGRVDGQLIVGEARGDRTLGMDDTGAAIWERLLSTGSIDETVTQLSREYSVAENRLRADVNSFVTSLRDKGLLEPVP